MQKKFGIPPDILLALLSAAVSFLGVFIFDIHHTFYPGGNLFAPQFIFTSLTPYFIGVGLGTIGGFLLLKALVYVITLKEEEDRKSGSDDEEGVN